MYFTKYIPVEGEIKEGYVLYDNNIHHTGRTSITPDTTIWLRRNTSLESDAIFDRNSEIEVYKSDCKKVKLMLCSRDIQVGDEIFVDVNGGEYHRVIDIVEDSIDCESFNGISNETFKREQCCKVIGEISSEALSYVKEGQEFEFLKECYISNSEIGQLKTFKIKGPCGHFH